MPFNNDFNWRPNDRSSTTMLRYQVESQRWMEGILSATASERHASHPMAPFMWLSMLLTLVLCIVIYLVLGIKYLFIGLGNLFKSQPQRQTEDPKTTNSGVDFERISDDDPDKAEKIYYQRMAAEHEERRRKQ